MATRRTFTVVLTDDTFPDGLITARRYAMNSGIRGSEEAVREVARSEKVYYHGGKPSRTGDVYTRVWTSDDGRVITATVQPEEK